MGPYMRYVFILGPYSVLLSFGNSHLESRSGFAEVACLPGEGDQAPARPTKLAMQPAARCCFEYPRPSNRLTCTSTRLSCAS